MTRIMYDAVTPGNVPASVTLVAGYGDGYYDNVAAFKARFPHATVVEIAVSSKDDLGTVLDVENGDAVPTEAPGWVQRRRAAGVIPTVYCNSSTWPLVQEAFRAAGVAEPNYWLASYDGDPTIPAGAVAKQYADPGPYDLSSVADYWPGVDPTPEADMPLNAADEAAIKTIVTDAIQANRGTAVADLLYWLAAGVTGVPPKGASAVDVSSISTLHSVVATLGGLTASLAAISKDGGLTAEQVTAAAQAGAAAALAELGKTLEAAPTA
jgi:hypothetical protein